MGNHLQIGQGIGDATVFNPAQAVQDFTNVLAQKKAQRDAERQQMIQQMGTLDPSKIRQQDQQDYYNKFNDWQQASIAAQQKPQNSYDKMVAQGEAQQKLNALHSFIGQSKQEQAAQMQLGQDMNKNPHMFSDDAHAQVMKSFNSPMSSPDYIPSSQFGNLSRYVNADAVDQKQEDGLAKVRNDTTNWGNPIIAPSIQRGEKGSITTESRGIPYGGQDGIAHRLLNSYSGDDDFKARIDRGYANIVDPNGDPATTTMMRIAQYAKDKGWDNGYNQTRINPFVPDKQAPQFSALENYWRNKNPNHEPYNLNPPGQANANAPTPAQTLLTGMQSGTAGSGEKLLSLAPQGQYGAQKPNINVDPNTGEHVFSFPAQITTDKKAKEANDAVRAAAKADGSDVDPAQLKPEVITKAPAKTYRLNPTSPDYIAQAAQMAKEQNINLPQLNQIEGKKGGHGIIPQAQGTQPAPSGLIKVKLPNGQVGQVPAAKFNDFKKKYPQAQQIQ